ncbi:hypothetical protein NS44R_15115, partial [Mammaliicoccus sciuri]
LLALEHLVDRHAGPARDDLRDVVGGDRLLHHLAAAMLAFARLDIRKLPLQLGDPAIGQFARLLEFAATLRIGQLDAERIEFALQLLGVGELVLLRAPARRQRRRPLLEPGELLLQRLQTALRAGVVLLLQRLLLDLEPDDVAVERVEFFGLGIDLHLQPCRGLVHQIDGLVGQEAVGDVAVRQRGGGDQRRVSNADAVMLLVFVLEAAQDRDGV